MPAAAVASSSLANGNTVSPFLDLPPELRNRIYEYTFGARKKSGLAPHALTRVSRQIRAESLAMYLECVHVIEIPLLSPNHERYFREWVATSMQSYPVLPHLEVSYHCPLKNIPYTTVRFLRLVVCPALEIDSLLEYGFQDPARSFFNMVLGAPSRTSHTNIRHLDPTEKFMETITERGSWHARCMDARLLYGKELADTWSSFAMLAQRTNGREWDKNDLITAIDFLISRKNAGRTRSSTRLCESHQADALEAWRLTHP